ncbi:DUF6932 family protein [Desulfomonile tiedjei]|uniref:Uncharacterized protein n=1 Tax=Desulfomonile tiedjei (strain ATCC 49306 / DSM 6799 / DCB-1) TaxID=706587 RepID=I4CBX6_DESTA|nr:hypothetical protein [Desulfomonile tiedjei]AFM27067.1 hypothetical protein Desti_4435 [Desulfomonile tiedjei DSM 6799]
MLFLPRVIPDFNGDGYLPEGIYPCGDNGLFFHFVESFPEAITREMIFDGFTRWRVEIRPLIKAIRQWVDGSFVTNKMNPHDVDVVSFCDTDYYNSLTKDDQDEIDRLLDGQRSTQSEYATHSILILSAPLGHPEHRDSEIFRNHYRKWLAKTYVEDPVTGYRVETNQRKGFLEMTLGEEWAAPIISTERIE